MEMLEIKSVIELKNIFHGLISRLDRAQERIGEFEVSRNFQNWNAKIKKYRTKYTRSMEHFQKQLGYE